MRDLEANYLSAVVVVRDDARVVIECLKSLHNALSAVFKYFEIIVVNNFSVDGTSEKLDSLGFPVTLVTLTNLHNTQSALTAGVELAIGDYILEIPSISSGFEPLEIEKLYRTCQEGNDFVFLSPKRSYGFSQLFYKLMNGYFKGKITDKFVSSIMTLSSRRGQNKTADIGTKLVNRNVSYVLTGLKCAAVQIDTESKNSRSLSENINLMIDTLIYHTNYISRLSNTIALTFLGVCMLAIAYSLICFFTIQTTPGWATTFIMISVSFGVLFGLLSIVFKYLSNLIKGQLPKNYTFSSVIKRGDK